MFGYKAMCLVRQDKVIGVLFCLFIHWQLCVYGNMMQGIAWKRDYHEILKKAKVEFSLGSFGNHADWVMVSIGSLVLLIFWWFDVLDCGFVYVMCCIFIGFHGFLLLDSWYYILCFKSLGNGSGNMKVNRAWEELNETQ